MEIRPWIKQAEKQGWRVSSVSDDILQLSCAKHGCSGSLKVSMDNPGPAPDPCTKDHVGLYAVKTFDLYQTLVAELRNRRCALGMDQGDLTAAMGVADGYVGKMESFARIPAFPTLHLWAQTLGLTLTVAPAPLPTATIAAIERRQGNPYRANQVRSKHAARA